MTQADVKKLDCVPQSGCLPGGIFFPNIGSKMIGFVETHFQQICDGKTLKKPSARLIPYFPHVDVKKLDCIPQSGCLPRGIFFLNCGSRFIGLVEKCFPQICDRQAHKKPSARLTLCSPSGSPKTWLSPAIGLPSGGYILPKHWERVHRLRKNV